MKTTSPMKAFTIRPARPDEAGLVLAFIQKLAVERNCGRMEWICLDWNESALGIYRSIGAFPLSEWTVQRLDEEALKEFAKKLTAAQ